MVHDEDSADDAPTGPLPIIQPPEHPEEAGSGMMPPPPPGPVPSVARERLEAGADPDPAVPREPGAEAVRRQDLMTAAVLGAFLVLLLGMLFAMAW